MTEGPGNRYYAFYATFVVIMVQLVITIAIWIILGHRSAWITVLVLCEVTALVIGAFTVREVIYSNALDVIGRGIVQVPLGPGFGFVGKRLNDAEIRDAFPARFPSGERGTPALSSAPDEDLERERAWTEELRNAYGSTQPEEEAPRPLVTTIGLVRLKDRKVKLAVVNYFQPRHLLRAWRDSGSAIRVAGETFPIVARPWLPVRHDGTFPNDGHCWVAFGAESGRCGVVTALHVIPPGEREVGSSVAVATSRSAINGTLRAISEIMDAALIEVDEADAPKLISTPHVEVVGFKPVEIVTGARYVNVRLKGKITGMPGFFDGGIYSRQPGGEPLMPATMTFNAHARHGDSGCLVLDLEGEPRGYTAPYLIYQGVVPLGHGMAEGYGLFLDQVAAQWAVRVQSSVPGSGVSGNGADLDLGPDAESTHEPGRGLEESG